MLSTRPVRPLVTLALATSLGACGGAPASPAQSVPTASASPAAATAPPGATAPSKPAAGSCEYGDGPSCRAKCEAGDPESCAHYSTMLFEGDGVAMNRPEACRVGDRACAAGSAIGCNNAGQCYLMGVGFTRDLGKASERLTKGCEGGNGNACHAEGGLQADAGRHERALALYEKGCVLGSLKACNDLGYAIEHGQGTKVDLRRAVELYEMACKGDDSSACNNLAYCLRDGVGIGQNPSRAFELFEKACKLGNTNSCGVLGSMFADGVAPVSVDEDKAIPLLLRSCDDGRGLHCRDLGYLYEHSQHGHKDLAAALKYYGKSCDAGFGGGCNNLGVMHRLGRGTPRDDKAGAAHFERGCSLGHGNACFELGQQHYAGLGVPKDVARAKELFKKACDGGHEKACDAWKVAGGR
jgi:TPR repeat protein